MKEGCACDYCGRKVDERSMVSIKEGKFFICQSCNGNYSEEELIEMLDDTDIL